MLNSLSIGAGEAGTERTSLTTIERNENFLIIFPILHDLYALGHKKPPKSHPHMHSLAVFKSCIAFFIRYDLYCMQATLMITDYKTITIQGRMEGGFWGFRKPPLTAKLFLKQPTSISARLLIH